MATREIAAGALAHSGAASVPDARPAAVVHLDLDGARHIFKLHGWHYDAEEDAIYVSGLRHALDAFAEAGVTATLFAIAEDLRDGRKRALLEEAVERGHEIASHSLTHRPLAGAARGDKLCEIGESRERLTRALGVHVDGFRAPNFSVDRECLELAAECGYAYDSSMIAGARPPRGRGLAVPPVGAHRPLVGRSLLELPLPPHRPLPFPFHPSYSLVLGNWYFRAGVKRAAEAPGPFVLLYHLIDFADPLPIALARGAARRLYTLSYRGGESKRGACRAMLERVRRDFAVLATRSVVAGVPGENDAEV